MKKKKRLLICGALLLFLGVVLVKQQISIYKINRERSVYQEQLSKLKGQEAQLNEQLKEMQGENYADKVARGSFGLIKPGEILIKKK
jgi:cell division protein FtsB